MDWLYTSLVDFKQLLDEAFVISRIIKVELGVISRSRSGAGTRDEHLRTSAPEPTTPTPIPVI